MSDCPVSGHGHELVYKNRYKILSDDCIAQSCYCIHCDEEMRRIYRRISKEAPEPDIPYDLTEEIVVDDPEHILRCVEQPCPSWIT